MEAVPCVAVDREAGEQTRQELAAAGLLAESYDIAADDETVYLPVTDPGAVKTEYTVVERPVEQREQPTTPADILGTQPSYERIGTIAVIEEADATRADQIADAIVASDLPIETVLNSTSKVKGEYRLREYELLRGTSTATVHREYGYTYAVDLAEVYFTPRLATERHRVTQQVDAGETVFDMFAGVGPYAIPAADQGAEVVAVDKNPAAVRALQDNARHNGVTDRLTAEEGDVREVANKYTDWADRIVMNLPHSGDRFLKSALAIAGDTAIIHYYDIQHETAPFTPGKEAVTTAAGAAGYDSTVETRQVVRSYAPHELNVRLDVAVTRND